VCARAKKECAFQKRKKIPTAFPPTSKLSVPSWDKFVAERQFQAKSCTCFAPNMNIIAKMNV
jgi:hypothetical protein